MAAWKVALRLSRRLRMVPALSSAEGRDRHAAEGGSLAQKRGLDSPERGRPLLGPTRLRKRTSDSLDGFGDALGSEGSTLPAPLIDHGHVDVGWRSREPALERQGMEEP
jgi:hypothetical protein